MCPAGMARSLVAGMEGRELHAQSALFSQKQSTSPTPHSPPVPLHSPRILVR